LQSFPTQRYSDVRSYLGPSYLRNAQAGRRDQVHVSFNNAAGELGLRESHPQPFEDGHLLTAPVGTLRANGFGVHDLIGNAWEWLADWYAADEYERCRHGVVDPRGPLSGSRRVLRGSSWRSPFVGSPRTGFRGQSVPDTHQTLARGFRVVLETR
ncbi:MAG: SUMF1/EgtB/PvdO family nonheme iron enzyme, partial [Planctomycetes bacterium]|nr:SUMF1/EgtB/PvdO family nonheme iron enzyme [Planctomycetota bacterium]